MPRPLGGEEKSFLEIVLMSSKKPRPLGGEIYFRLDSRMKRAYFSPRKYGFVGLSTLT